MKEKISAVIICKNEELVIEECLKSLINWVDEVIAIDSGSTDRTLEICKNYQVKLIETEWKGYAETKNLGNQNARNNWILSIDADEVVSDELKKSIENLTFYNNQVYSLDRINEYLGKWIRYSGWYPDWKVRLFNKQNAKWVGSFVHEKLVFENCSVIKLKGKLYHHSVLSREKHHETIIKYSQLAAKEMFEKNQQPSKFPKLLAFWHFFKTYFIKLGFLDGKAGYEISLRKAQYIKYKEQYLRQLIDKK